MHTPLTDVVSFQIEASDMGSVAVDEVCYNATSFVTDGQVRQLEERRVFEGVQLDEQALVEI